MLDGRPHDAKPDEEAQTATVPTQLPQQKTESPPRPSSDQVEICIEAHKPSHDDRKAQRLSSAPSPAGLRSSRQKPRQPPRVQEDTKPLKPSWLKMISGVMPFEGFFDRGKGKIPRRSLLRQRTTSTEMIITTDAAVQLEKPAMVDDSQQVSEAPVTGGWFDTASVYRSKLDAEVTLGQCIETTATPKRRRITENFVPIRLDGEASRSSRTTSGSATNTENSELVLRDAQRHKDRDLAVATICHDTISEPSLLQNTSTKSAGSSKFSSSQESPSSDHSAVVPTSTTPGLFTNHSKISLGASGQDFDDLYLQMQGPSLKEMTELSSSCNATSDGEEISRKSAAGKDIEVAVV
ncbi:uncharacterized protein LOC120843459 [Ixodes scapularis]|uniref:uncharacterized protein LOC120843459 n=1 Tax=Ixodes scapularis TaxID=6945 RepID=UPI001A9F2B26|nr:uncharacterized protein LOC120843459 [Ixodes scapularis]